MSLIEALKNASMERVVAVDGGCGAREGGQLWADVRRLSLSLSEHRIDKLAIYGDNSADWIALDLACLDRRVVCLPLPLFFSAQQIRHAVESSGVTAVAVVGELPLDDVFPHARKLASLSASIELYDVANPATTTHRVLPPETQKITFTSGSTGAPKGVCLSAANQVNVMEALQQRIAITGIRHLCLLPLSTLLENVAGVYVALRSGGTVVVPPLAEVGLAGSSGLNIEHFLQAFHRWQPNSVILLPQTLKLLVMACESGWVLPSSLQFVAVGGGTVSPHMITKARALGIPVFQGYGLSECGSVVCLNGASNGPADSVGEPLEHLSLRLDAGEICVRGNAFLGYVGLPESWGQQEVRTGDMGIVDHQGRVYLRGRKKHVQISSFGRNVDPEWIESELLTSRALMQAVVTTDASPYCVALIVPASEQVNDAEIQQGIERVNERLPDYARVRQWRRLDQPLSVASGLLTENGRLKRDLIYQRYRALLDAMYEHQLESI